MSPLSTDPAPQRRSDAQRNAAAILAAAARVLGERPEAGLAEIARSAGITRKTLYAHFPSRDALINALIEQATARVIAALDAADLGRGPADEALLRLMEAGWRSFDVDPFLFHVAAPPVTAEQDRDRHAPVMERLAQVLERGQSEGTIDSRPEPGWILACMLALAHAAGEEVRAGRMTSEQAVTALKRDIPKLVRP